jgi:hypothetical protein
MLPALPYHETDLGADASSLLDHVGNCLGASRTASCSDKGNPASGSSDAGAWAVLVDLGVGDDRLHEPFRQIELNALGLDRVVVLCYGWRCELWCLVVVSGWVGVSRR